MNKLIAITLLSCLVCSQVYAYDNGERYAQVRSKSKKPSSTAKKRTAPVKQKELTEKKESPADTAEEITEPAQEEKKEDLEGQYKPYGYLSFTVFPGFKRIRLDRENTIGFSENILVPAGRHWIEIISPKGYADTSFKIEVGNGESVQMVVQLRDKLTGKLAPVEEKPKKRKSKGTFWTVLQITCASAGIVTGYLAYRQETMASDAQDEYENAGVNTTPEKFNELNDDVAQHVSARNGMAVASAASFLIGGLLFLFK